MNITRNLEIVTNAKKALENIKGKISEEEIVALQRAINFASDLAPDCGDRNTDGKVIGAILEDFINNLSAKSADLVRYIIFHWHRALQQSFFEDVIRPYIKTYANLEKRHYDDRNASIVHWCKEIVENNPLPFDYAKDYSKTDY